MKKVYQYIITFSIFFFSVMSILGQSTLGPLNPGLQGNSACTFSYSSSLNIAPAGNTAASDNIYATASHCACCDANTNCLQLTDFGAALPTSAVIQGILVEIEKKGSAGSYIVDNGLKLLKNGVEVGQNKANTTSPWPSSDTYSSYGGATDLWGSTWTASDINSSNFGLVFASIDYTCAGVTTSFVDHVRITIYYSNCTSVVNAQFSSSSSYLTYNFTDMSSGATSWFWDLGDGNTSTQQNPSHIYADTGSYTVCLIAMDSCASDTFCTTINVCVPPTAQYTFTKNQLAVQFTETGSYATSYMWDFGDGGSSTLQNPSHLYADTGTYYVCLYVSGSCGLDTLCDTVVVCRMPVADFLVNTSFLTATFTSTSTNATWWHWDFGNGDTSNVENPIYVFTNYGSHDICLIAGNACYQDTFCKQIVIGQVDPIQVSEYASDLLQVYPNPADNTLFIKIDHAPTNPALVTIFDVSGKLLISQSLKLVTGSAQLDVSTLVPGNYLLKIEQGDAIMTKQVIIGP